MRNFDNDEVITMLQGYGTPTSSARRKTEFDEVAQKYCAELLDRHARLHVHIDEQLAIVIHQLDCLLWPESRRARLRGGLIRHPEITVHELVIRQRSNGITR